VTPEAWQRAERLFEQALTYSSSDRGAFLREICGEDGTTRRVVESLLAADEQAGSFLVAPAFGDAVVALANADAPAAEAESDAPSGFRAGDRVGPYVILHALGEGGMSTVYLASRPDMPEPFRVALKLVKPGMDTQHILQRFRQEREILAGLDHPNIARLADCGTVDGRPYFVMEYVEGLPIDQYSDEHGLSIEARLMLFQSVCAAVHYAHRNLVVHRDLKPSNVLVSAQGVPKLLDFGIAKLLDPHAIADGPDRTTASQCFWTPQYASPEQVQGRIVTTATDVYSLGVLLYKLLSGRRPYELATLSPQEIQRVVCEAPPQPLRRALPHDAKLRRRLSGDLDNIVLMALRKEPERRYPSVLALSEDVGRHLNDRPVLARPNTLGYRAGKYVRRNAAAVVASALACLCLISGTGIALWQARTAIEERRQADVHRARAERVSAFLIDLFKVWDPAEARASSISAREILERGTARMAVELKDEPEVRATLLDTVGTVYQNLGLYEPADGLFAEALAERRRLLGPLHPDVATSLTHIASLRRAQFRPADSVAFSRQALAIRQRVFGNDDLRVAENLQWLASALQITDSPETEALIRQALVIRRKRLGEDHPDVAESLDTLAWFLLLHDRYAEADPIYARVLAMRQAQLGADHPAVLETIGEVADLRLMQGRYAESVRLNRQALADWERIKGHDHPEVAAFETALAGALGRLGQFDEAETLTRHALDRRIAIWGEGHAAVDNSWQHLGSLLYLRGDYEQAEVVLRKSLRQRVKLWGERHRSVAKTTEILARVRLARGDAAQAADLFAKARATWQAILGDECLEVARSLDGLARARQALGEGAAAERLFEKSLALRTKILGRRHPDVAETLAGLGALRAVSDPRRAEPLFREALAIRREVFPPGHWQIAEAVSLLGDCWRAQGRGAEAEPLLREGLAGLRAGLGDGHPLTREARRRWVHLQAASPLS
jgi:eukaryotic-like serine/threonine-protein kinase